MVVVLCKNPVKYRKLLFHRVPYDVIVYVYMTRGGAGMSKNSKLVVVWTSGDREVALKMVFMYTFNAKKRGWWDDITFIVWGPSEKLLAEDKELQDYLKKMFDVGVRVEACKSCSDMYGVSESLEKLGVDVKYMGVPLTDYIKEDLKVITF
jgi:hypothetical protein